MKTYDPNTTSLRHIHALLCETIAPRPLVLVSSLDAEGKKNAAPFSSIMPITGKAPLLVLSFNRRRNGSRKRTTENILATHEFVVNIVEEAQLDEALELSLRQPRGSLDKWPRALPALPSEKVRVPRLEGCRAALECTVQSHQVLGSDNFLSDLIIGRIVNIWRASSGELQPMGCLGLDTYTNGECRLHRPFPSSKKKS